MMPQIISFYRVRGNIGKNDNNWPCETLCIKPCRGYRVP